MEGISAIDAGVDHPYYSLKNRFVGFNSTMQGGMNEGSVISQVGSTQTPTPESTKATYTRSGEGKHNRRLGVIYVYSMGNTWGAGCAWSCI